MPMNPQDVVRKEFREAFRGYNQADVDLFLDEVVDEMTRLVEESQRMKVRITALQQELARYRPAEATPPEETSEARWRLRRFLEEQGRPLDEIEQMPRSPTVERMAREIPPGPEPREGASGARPVAPRDDDTVRATPPAPELSVERVLPSEDEPQNSPPPRPRQDDSKPFWAAE